MSSQGFASSSAPQQQARQPDRLDNLIMQADAIASRLEVLTHRLHSHMDKITGAVPTPVAGNIQGAVNAQSSCLASSLDRLAGRLDEHEQALSRAS